MLDFGASLLKFILSEMYNYLINFQPVLFGVPLQLGALSVRLVRLWVNPALAVLSGFGKWTEKVLKWRRQEERSKHERQRQRKHDVQQ